MFITDEKCKCLFTVQQFSLSILQTTSCVGFGLETKVWVLGLKKIWAGSCLFFDELRAKLKF